MKFLQALFLMLVVTHVHGQSNLPACQGSDASKWTNCFGHWTAQNGYNYIGEWKNGKQEGLGTATFPSGDKHIGEYKNGAMSGQGTYYYTSNDQFKGDKYVGEFKNDRRNGQGTYYYLAENQYKGDKHTGEYIEDVATGQGTYSFSDGRVWLGEWKKYKLDGRAIKYSADGMVIESGIYKDGLLVTSQYIDPLVFHRISKNKAAPLVIDNDQGQTNASACQGNDDSRWNNCLGTLIFSKGDKYVGEFKNGQKNGWGTYYFLADDEFKGDKYVGESRDGTFNGNGTYFYSSGDKHVGEYRDGKPNGPGTYFYFAENKNKGDKYVGDFKDGKKSGQGKYTFSDGRVWLGEWADDKANGRLIQYSANGTIDKSGIFLDNKLVTSQYIDSNSFNRIAKNKTSPVGPNSERQEMERKAAKLEEERRRLEEEKRQFAIERQRIDSQRGQTPPIAPDNRRRLALVIGNDNYSSLPSLSNAVNDSKAMSDALKQVNFEVYYYKNLSKRGMEEALHNFAKKLTKDDVGMFYFAGHGIQADNRNFLIPVGENVKKPSDVQFEGLDVNRVMASLQDSRNALNIVVLDACRSSLDVRGGLTRGLVVTEAPQSSIVAYATSPGKTASDGDGGNSPFTKNLIRVMQRKGLKIEDVFKEVRVAVSRETNGEQVPQEVSQLVSDFYFRP